MCVWHCPWVKADLVQGRSSTGWLTAGLEHGSHRTDTLTGLRTVMMTMSCNMCLGHGMVPGPDDTVMTLWQHHAPPLQCCLPDCLHFVAASFTNYAMCGTVLLLSKLCLLPDGPCACTLLSNTNNLIALMPQVVPQPHQANQHTLIDRSSTSQNFTSFWPQYLLSSMAFLLLYKFLFMSILCGFCIWQLPAICWLL